MLDHDQFPPKICIKHIYYIYSIVQPVKIRLPELYEGGGDRGEKERHSKKERKRVQYMRVFDKEINGWMNSDRETERERENQRNITNNNFGLGNVIRNVVIEENGRILKYLPA